TALKQRVDPDGVRNLIWRPQGATRLEIQMPLTSQSTQARAAREAYATAREKLEATNIRVAAVVDDLTNLSGADREARIRQYAQDSKLRGELLPRLAEQIDRRRAALAAKDIPTAAAARMETEAIEAQLNDTNLPTATLETTLDLDKDARAARLKQLKDKAADFPSRQSAIDAFAGSFDEVAKLGGGLDSAEELKRLLRGSGVLSFHILANDIDPATQQQWITRLQQNGPRPQPGDIMRWFEVGREGGINSVPYGGKNYALVYVDSQHSMVNAPGLPEWAVQTVRPGQDEMGGNSVDFTFDSVGGRLFTELTSRYRATDSRRYNLALVLDEKLISAPTLPDRPIGNNVQITSGTGGFSKSELDYLVTTLSAGSLPAQLTNEPISEVTVGPQLGADNLRAGLVSCVLGLVIVFVFLVGYYYVSGLVAFIAVLINLVLIIGAMTIINATFTLPGVAGVVLSVAIAVDANVLIFERLREEQARGLGLKMALRNSYDRAFSAIFDGQVTTAISSAFLYVFGSEEVRGFGLTLLIGIVTSLFTSLYVTKTIFGLMVDRGMIRDLSSLPRTFPKWNQLLTPRVDWIKLSPAFVAFSVAFIGLGLICFGIKLSQGQALDIEFSGGTAVRVALLPPVAGEKPIDRATMQDLLSAQSQKRPTDLAAPRVVSLGGDNLQYEISTPTTDARAVQAAVIEAIGPRLDIAKPSTFDAVSDDYSAAENRAVYPIETAQTRIEGVSNYLTQSHVGGAAIVLNNLNPPLDAKTIRTRVRERADQEKPEARPENIEVETFDNDRRAVVVISDSRYAYDAADAAKAQAWRASLAAPAWQMVRDAVNNPPQLKGVTSFNAQVADEAKWNTTMALIFSILGILAYIWIRFGNLKFGTATVVAAVHDALFVLAAIGFSHYLGQIGFIENVLLIRPFRLDLTIVAAVLTVIGYSLNDTVVIFDRIRENRGKYGVLSRKVINDSINQTFSRTLLTGGTSMGILLVMYVLGGEGIHGFTFVMLLGIIVGTYSSLAVASPLLLIGKTVDDKVTGTTTPSGPITTASAG
ncbi:MAG TPA: protein translocase subunit SecD, partial [Tepidisphaeraceae bacterium]